MKLLVFHVFAGSPGRQQLYAELASLTGWEITLVVGANWRSEYGTRVAVQRASDYQGSIAAVPLILSGNIPLHVYRSTLIGLINREAPDAIYVYHEPYGLATFQVFLANRLSARVPIGFYSAQNIAKRYPYPFRRMERWIFSQSEFAVAISDQVAAVLRSKGYDGRLRVIPFELDMDKFQGTEAGRSCEHSVQPMRVGYVGRLVPEKGVDTLINALTQMPPGSVQASIVGGGSSSSSLRRLADQLLPEGLLRWHGYVPNAALPDVYRQLDVLVVPSKSTPSWKEQFGRVVIEALACGVAVIASDSGELPFLVGATHGGWTFAEGDARDLAAKLNYARDHRSELEARKVAGQKAVRARYCVRSVACQLSELVAESVGDRRVGTN